MTTFTAGSALLMWMGELITNRGIGNGMSLIIFCSVVSGLPSAFSAVYGAENGAVKLAVFIAFFLVMLGFIVFIELGQRRIPVQFAKRVVGRRMYSGQSTYIPLKVNQAGVVPIIFASAVINLPVLLSQVLPSDGWGATVSSWINDNLANTVNPIYLIFLGLLIVGFAYFYTAIAFDPVQQADNLRKQGGFIPGIRPGPQTESYLSKVLNRITLPGAIFIAILAIAPTVLVRFLLGSGASGAAVLVRRHVPAHRRRRRPRDDEAGRQPADDAQLRGVPLLEVSRRTRAGPAAAEPVGITLRLLCRPDDTAFARRGESVC